jgi:hypothetical protein
MHTEETVVLSVLSGLNAFSRSWEAVSIELLSTKEPWNFSKKAPKGPTAKIVQIECGAMFVTVANRAMKTRLFERSSLTKIYLEGELQPHRIRAEDLPPTAREKAVKRINKAITDDMKTFVEFGLFETTEKKHVYRLTELGASYYERLASQSIPVGGDYPNDERDLPRNERAGVGFAAGGSHSPVTLHEP